MTTARAGSGYSDESTDPNYQQILDALLYTQNVVAYLCFLVNIVKIAVFVQKSMRNTPSGKFILTIAVSHFIRLFIGVSNIIIQPLIISEPEKLYAYDLYLLYIGTNVSTIIYRASLFIACLMSLERMYAVSRPLHIKQFVLARRPAVFIAVIFVVTACYHIYFSLQFKFDLKPGTNGTQLVVLGYTDLYLQNRALIDAFSVASKVIFVYFPLVCVIVLNACLVHFLRRHSDTRKAIKNNANEETVARRDRQMTLTVLAATVGYVIFILPAAVHYLAIAVVPEYNYAGKKVKLLYLMDKVQDICLQLSYIADFLGFVLLSKAFRESLLRLLICRRRLKGQPVERSKDSDVTSDMTSLSS